MKSPTCQPCVDSLPLLIPDPGCFAALENAFQFDQSAARPAGSMNPRALIIFEHNSQLGSAPSHKLFEAVTVTRKEGVEVPRSFGDYDLAIAESAIPEGVSLIRRI
ncbi:MAG: CRISPR-associated protein Csd2 [Verrucomicrobiales bacterium]|jgi:CRISPR-associated protein Csd2